MNTSMTQQKTKKLKDTKLTKASNNFHMLLVQTILQLAPKHFYQTISH